MIPMNPVAGFGWNYENLTGQERIYLSRKRVDTLAAFTYLFTIEPYLAGLLISDEAYSLTYVVEDILDEGVDK